jgi:hypothetical protein
MGGELALCWESAAALLASDASAAGGGSGGGAALVAQSMAHNATALCVTGWLRSVARAHAAALAEHHGGLCAAEGLSPTEAAQNLDASSLQQLMLTADYVTAMEARLASARPAGLALPVAAGAVACAGAAECATWHAACAGALDGMLTWLAHSKTAAEQNAHPRNVACLGVASAKLTEAFVGGAEEALALRRQWLLCGGGGGCGVPEKSAELQSLSVATVAVLSAVLLEVERAAAPLPPQPPAVAPFPFVGMFAPFELELGGAGAAPGGL